MEMTGERRIPAPRQRVWERLNDPETLKECIPGCETIEKVSDTEFTAKVVALTGPTLATTLAVNSVSETFSIVSHPGMHSFSVSGSLSRSQTRWRGTGMRRSPVISMRVVLGSRGKGECGSRRLRLQRASVT